MCLSASVSIRVCRGGWKVCTAYGVGSTRSSTPRTLALQFINLNTFQYSHTQRRGFQIPGNRICTYARNAHSFIHTRAQNRYITCAHVHYIYMCAYMSHFFWWVLQHWTGFARLVWGRLRVHPSFYLFRARALHIHVCIHVSYQTSVYIGYIYIHVSIYMYTYIYIYIDRYIYVYICMYTYAYMCVYLYM